MIVKDLFEAATDVLYHSTSILSAANILKSKEFRLTSSVGTDTERKMHSGDRFYYLSTARTKINDYALHNTGSAGVTFVLNGRWLTNRYKAVAVDYWESWWIKQREHGATDRTREAEDRIFSYDPDIPFSGNENKLILALHILIKEAYTVEEAVIKTILIFAKRYGVPVYFYKDKKAYIMQDIRKAIPTSEVMDLVRTTPKSETNRSSISKDWLKKYRELLQAPDKSTLSKDAKYILDNILYYFDDAVRSFSADLHNARSNDRQRADLVKTVALFRKHKIKSPKEFLTIIRDKFDK